MPQSPQPSDESDKTQAGERPQSYAADPFERATDRLVGLHLKESRRTRQSIIAFDEKPPQGAIDLVKAAGFHWENQEGHWAKRIGGSSAMQDRADADWLYDELSRLLREELGLSADGRSPV